MKNRTKSKLTSGATVEVTLDGVGGDRTWRITVTSSGAPATQTSLVVPYADLAAFADALQSFATRRGSVAPRVAIEPLALRYRRDAERTGSEDDVSIAHMLLDLHALLRAPDHKTLGRVERAAVERRIAAGDSWGAGAPRVREHGKPSLAGRPLLDIVTAEIAQTPDELRAALAARDPEFQPSTGPGSSPDPAYVVAESIVINVRLLFPHLHERLRDVPEQQLAEELAARLRKAADRKPSFQDLDPVSVATQALRIFGMKNPHNVFRYKWNEGKATPKK